VAAHVGKPVEAVSVTTVEAGAVYEARDPVPGGARLHVCDFDDAGRLAALIHPGA
jgi:hypothetical protein